MAAQIFTAATNLTTAATNLTSLFSKPTSLSAYNLHTTPNGPSSIGSSSSAGPSTASTSTTSKGFVVGLWRVVGATHKTTGKDVSVWVFEKRILDGVKGGSGRNALEAREWTIEQLKKEATSLSRLRHPDLLQMVESLEESRTELTFVTEYITSSLQILLNAATGSSSRQRDRNRPPGGDEFDSGGKGHVDLDEVEVQKGVLQVSRALAFLHGPGKSVHLNLNPESILVNAKGDWKLSGLHLLKPLQQPDGSSTRYQYPEVDVRIPPQVQWRYDYLAPEYALDSQLTTSNDLYSLGCVLYAVHMGGKPPFSNGGSMQSLRDHAENELVRKTWMRGSKWEQCSQEVKDLLPRLLTRSSSNRLSLASLPSHPFFSSLAISTLNFLDSTTFASKPREEKATFLRGLVRVLPTFSERLRKGKILPSLLEEMKDSYLLPFILPNIFEISKTLNKEEFTMVLPKLQPLFALKDPPQNMLTLLEHLTLFEEKTSPPLFRENVMPLIYNSLECEHLPVQEKVLKLVPHLCEVLDYGTVHNILLVKVAILFTRTRILSVKVLTLQTFREMVSTLDKATLTTKLVPLLAKIKTREPAVMMATLGVHEAMGAKVDREAIATLVLPQLWAMSMGPLLNEPQFRQFMKVIKELGGRVEKEHGDHLRDVRRLESSQNSHAAMSNGLGGESWDQTINGAAGGGEVDFETLVKGSNGSVGIGSSNSMNVVNGGGIGSTSTDIWDDGGWADGGEDALSQAFGNSLNTTTSNSYQAPSINATQARPSSNVGSVNKLKARPVDPSAFNSAAFSPPEPISPAVPNYNTASSSTFAPLQPSMRPSPASRSTSTSSTSNGPNYNLSLSPQQPILNPQKTFNFASAPMAPPIRPMQNGNGHMNGLGSMQPSSPQRSTPSAPLQPTIKPPPGFSSGVMQPTKKSASGWTATSQPRDWGDFDPLK